MSNIKRETPTVENVSIGLEPFGEDPLKGYDGNEESETKKKKSVLFSRKLVSKAAS